MTGLLLLRSYGGPASDMDPNSPSYGTQDVRLHEDACRAMQKASEHQEELLHCTTPATYKQGLYTVHGRGRVATGT